MGWTSIDEIPCGMSRGEFLKRELEFQRETSEGTLATRVVDSRTRGANWCAALEVRAPLKKPTITAVVALTRKMGGQFAWKFIGESEGPFYTGFPLRLLDLLTEPPNDTAAAWRAKVRESEAKRKETAT